MTDALGYRMKFGVIAPSTNTIVQPDFDDMRPRGVTNHFARIHIPDKPVETDKDFDDLVASIDKAQYDAIDRVMTCHPQRIVMGMSAETFWGGAEQSVELHRSMEARAGVPVTMGSQACQAALSRFPWVKRVGVVTPYMPIGDANVERFFKDIGFDVRKLIGLRCKSPVLIAHVTTEQLRDALVELNQPDVDAIVQVGTNMSMVSLAASAELMFNKPVIAINTATYWHGLRSCGINDQMVGFGSLLEKF